MPIEIDGKLYYRMADIYRALGVSRSTLLRWLKKGVLERSHRDRKGWRVFTEEDFNRIRAEASKIQVWEKP